MTCVLFIYIYLGNEYHHIGGQYTVFKEGVQHIQKFLVGRRLM